MGYYDNNCVEFFERCEKIYGRNRGEEVIMLPGKSAVNFLILGVRMVILVLMPLFILLTILSFTPGFKFLSDKLLPIKIKKYANEFVFGGISILLVIGNIVIGGGITK